MTRSLREQSQTLPAFALSLFQSACNWIQSLVIYGSGCNKPRLWKHNQVFGGCKRKRRGAASSFCLLQGMVELLLLQIRVCLSMCLSLLLKAAGAHGGRQTRLDVSTQAEPLLQFLLWHLSGQSLRGQWKPDQLAALKALTFYVSFLINLCSFPRVLYWITIMRKQMNFFKTERFQCPPDLPELRHQKDDTSCCPAAATGKDSL